MLTPKQQKVYEWIREHIRRRGTAPSYEEIKEGMGFGSLNTVHYHLKKIEGEGLIRSPWANKKRAIEILTDSMVPPLPLLGEVCAGYPVESYEIPEEITLPPDFFGNPDEHFALRVRGESMVGEGIMEGDVIVVRKTGIAENSQVVVALVDGDATVKRFRRRGPTIELIPANPDFETIVADESQVQIMGTVVALFRKY